MKANCQSSGTCLVAMKLCVAVVVCLSALGYGSVRAEVCPGTKNDCRLTDFTFVACNLTSNQCECVTNNPNKYQAIPSGCAARPVVQLDAGRTSEFYTGSTVTLNCFTPDTNVTFAWKRNGNPITNSLAQRYQLTGNDMEKSGSYSCVTSEGQVSQESDPVTVTLVATTGPASPPIVTAIPVAAVPGATIDGLQCTNIPYGATYKFQLTKDPTQQVDSVTHNTTNGNITCVISSSSGAVNATSSPVPWNTTDAVDITAVTTDLAGTKYYKPSTSVNLTCVTTPIANYMMGGTPSKIITYYIQDTANSTAAPVANFYTVKPASGTHNIMCIASYDGQPNKTSAQVSIVFDDNLGLVAPGLKANSKEVKLGAQLVLTCTPGNAVTDFTYSWKRNGVSIARQKDSVIQFNNFQDADAGKYVCTANKDTVSRDSNVEEVKAASSGVRILGSILLVLVALASSKIL